jgi:acyl-CoA dehydrogenase
MRSIGAAQMALDLMIQRVTDPTRKTFGKLLYEHGQQLRALAKEYKTDYFTSGTVVADIAKSRAEIESSRLLVLSAAMQVSKTSHNYYYNVPRPYFYLQIDKHKAKGAMKEIGIAKVS